MTTGLLEHKNQLYVMLDYKVFRGMRLLVTIHRVVTLKGNLRE